MKIGISINEVLRNFLGQFAYTYEKYIGDIDIKEEDVTNFNLIEFFKFENVNRLNSFLYSEASLEVFGHAGLMSDGLMNHFNNFLMDMKDDGEHEIELVSREVNRSIPSTFFFLSKVGAKTPNVRFVTNYADKWNGVDVLITACPDALNAKPNGKISVKVKAPYNKDVQADYEIDSILDFIRDEELRDKILSTKITTYEEIK